MKVIRLSNDDSCNQRLLAATKIIANPESIVAVERSGKYVLIHGMLETLSLSLGELIKKTGVRFSLQYITEKNLDSLAFAAGKTTKTAEEVATAIETP